MTRGFSLPLTIRKEDKVGDVARAMRSVGAEIGKLVTNEYAQRRADYTVDIVITMEETNDEA